MGMNGITSAAPMRGCAPCVRGQVDQFGGLADATNRGLLNGFALADQRDHAAVVVGIHFAVEQVDAGHLHGFDNGIDCGLVAAFREIRNTFDECGHKYQDKAEGTILRNDRVLCHRWM